MSYFVPNRRGFRPRFSFCLSVENNMLTFATVKKVVSMIIREVKYSYKDGQYHLGPYIDFIAELKVPSCDYEDIVDAIQKKFPEYEEIRVMCFKRT